MTSYMDDPYEDSNLKQTELLIPKIIKTVKCDENIILVTFNVIFAINSCFLKKIF